MCNFNYILLRTYLWSAPGEYGTLHNLIILLIITTPKAMISSFNTLPDCHNDVILFLLCDNDTLQLMFHCGQGQQSWAGPGAIITYSPKYKHKWYQYRVKLRVGH